MSGQVLTIKNLCYSYGPHFSLENINLSLSSGENIGLTGPNGSGKSTLLKLLIKILNPPGNSVFIGNTDIRQMKQNMLAKRISYLPQIPAPADEFTVEDIIRMGRYVHSFSGYSLKDNSVIEETMKRLSLYDMRKRRISGMSGGEFQRVLLARTLVQESEIILLDEPTNHLDMTNQINILTLLKEEQKLRPLSIISVFHDINLAFDFSDRIVLIKSGKTVNIDIPEKIAESPDLESVFSLEFTRMKNPLSGKPLVIPHPCHSNKI